MTEPTAENPQRNAAKPTSWQRISAYAFLGAFGLTVLTVILTGLAVRNPAARRAPETQVVTLAVAEPRIVNLLFTSRAELDDVRFTVDFPPGIEANGKTGVRRISWSAPLAAGDNFLPLTLVARQGGGGQLAAQLQHGNVHKTFVVDVAVGPR
ncbi:MAG: hypothetical protein ABI640_09545 [Gammaproteobacteria bacterium]